MTAIAYPNHKATDRVREVCGNCGGSGVYNAPTSITFYTPAVGTESAGCFACHGTGYRSILVSSVRARARRAERQAAQRKAAAARYVAEREAEEARNAATRDAWVAKHPDLAAVLEDLRGDFGADMRSVLNSGANFTERQIAALQRIAEQRASEPAPAPVIEGRIEITGTVRTTKWVDNDYGGSMKMLIVDDRGFKVWGTVPASLEIDAGVRVTFTATVEASRDDETFGFYKRPTKVKVLPA